MTFKTAPDSRLNHATRMAVMILVWLCIHPLSALADQPAVNRISDLVGLIIAPEVPFKRAGNIPGWESIGSEAIGGPGRSMYVEQGHTQNEYGFLLVESIGEDRTLKILDGVVLPEKLTGRSVKSGKLRQNMSSKSVQYGDLSFPCNIKGNEGTRLIGVALPEKNKEGCMQRTPKILALWRINEETGKLEAVSTKNAVCHSMASPTSCN